jgi:hypothetical protein
MTLVSNSYNKRREKDESSSSRCKTTAFSSFCCRWISSKRGYPLFHAHRPWFRYFHFTNLVHLSKKKDKTIIHHHRCHITVMVGSNAFSYVLWFFSSGKFTQITAPCGCLYGMGSSYKTGFCNTQA